MTAYRQLNRNKNMKIIFMIGSTLKTSIVVDAYALPTLK